MLITKINHTLKTLKIFKQQKFLRLSSGINVKCYSHEANERPIPYSTSEASRWKAEFSRQPPVPERWRMTPYFVAISTISFMLYFFVLREENDIDEIIYRPLPETIKGMKEAHPQFDFYTKPAYVRYHEEKKKEKMKLNELKEQ